MRTALVCFALLLPASQAAAQEGGFTYEQFEVSIPHLDLDTCTPDMPQEGVFCRAALLYDALHVYAFRDDGSSAFETMKSYDADAFSIIFD